MPPQLLSAFPIAGRRFSPEATTSYPIFYPRASQVPIFEKTTINYSIYMDVLNDLDLVPFGAG